MDLIILEGFTLPIDVYVADYIAGYTALPKVLTNMVVSYISVCDQLNYGEIVIDIVNRYIGQNEITIPEELTEENIHQLLGEESFG